MYKYVWSCINEHHFVTRDMLVHWRTLCIFMYVRTYICICVYVCVHIDHAYIYACTDLNYTYIHIQTHTHTRTHINIYVGICIHKALFH